MLSDRIDLFFDRDSLYRSKMAPIRNLAFDLGLANADSERMQPFYGIVRGNNATFPDQPHFRERSRKDPPSPGPYPPVPPPSPTMSGVEDMNITGDV